VWGQTAVSAALLMLAASEAFWLDVPFVRQEKEGCGSAAVAMVVRYWMKERPELPPQAGDAREIHRRVYSAEAGGSPAGALVRYFEDTGFEAFAFEGDWKALEAHLTKGRPLIVCLSNGRGGARHYVVVVGVSEREAAIHDPAAGKLRLGRREEFERRWNGAGRWALLAVPRRVP